MKWTNQQLWEQFQRYYTEYPELKMALDLSRMDFPEDYFKLMEKPMTGVFEAMAELEKGAVANPDEKRQVGHYWLRTPELNPKFAAEIQETVERIKAFAYEIHQGKKAGERGPFKNLLVIGIGGSALGPQLAASALGHPLQDKMQVYFFDNTDPDGMDRTLAHIVTELGQTLCVVISKSGGTKETRNGMLEAMAAWKNAGLNFSRHAVAVTQMDRTSELFIRAKEEEWLDIFPMWEWVGGRTSETSAVGLLPAALQGLDIDALLAGARACDAVTRQPVLARNPAAQMALAWYWAGGGRGAKDMVVLPYKDRLELFSRYLQQLVMESLGKELDLQGRVVNQGLAVYGNKGSTDQHAYVQQLRDGLNNFFVTFIEVLRDRQTDSPLVEGQATSGDFLSGFLLGTRQALFEKGRLSLTITLQEITPYTLGVLIALFERTVGFYASLIGINAYHQPGVQAGKKAAEAIIKLQEAILKQLDAAGERPQTVEQIAQAIGRQDECEMIFKICEHLAANPQRRVGRKSGANPFAAGYFRIH